MFDRIFAPALTFLMLIGGTVAIGSGLFATPRAELVAAAQRPAASTATSPAPAPLMLERVVITAKRTQVDATDAQPTPAQPAPRQAAEGRGVMLRTQQD